MNTSRSLPDADRKGAHAMTLQIDPAAPTRAWWDRERFLTADTPDGKCRPSIDVTGLPRFLVFGPYIELTPGVWRATVSLHICPDAARRPLAVQLGAEPDYATVDLPLGVAGPHEIEIDHARRESGLGQVRLWLKKAAFHGEIRFIGAWIERIGDIALPSGA